MTPEFHANNRRQLAQRLRGGVFALSNYTGMQRSADAAFNFEPEANFWYLAGISEPDWWLIVDGARDKSWLVEPDVSDISRVFDGGLSTAEAKQISGVDKVITEAEAADLLRDLSKTHSVIYSIGDPVGADNFSFTLNPAPRNLWRRLERTFRSVQDATLDLSRLRAIKQPAEIKQIKKAITLTTEAFSHVKSQLQQTRYEYEIEAEFSYYFRSRGARGHAYDPIVAAGKNACTLHYSTNQLRLKTGQLVLIDVGARLGGYAADITRTYAYGEISAFSRQVHEAVAESHQKIIDLLRPGLSIAEYHRQSDLIMKRAMLDLKLIKSLDDQNYRRYFPHAISHGLGIDVHDMLGRPEEFAPGMVLTVEPGIYIPEKSVGVRIEDNILITKSGCENLSRNLSTDS
jgi:Xaa-Pro aminopeptidase